MKWAVVLATVLALGAARAPRGGSNLSHLSALLRNDQVGINLCPTCIQFTEEAINELLDIILNAGVVGTCGTLCQALAQKTGSQALGEVCTILCDIAGVEEFVKLIQKADLDPIYFCELINTCPVFDNGDASITDLTVDPASGPQGPRSISFTISSKKGTGTGELILFVETVDGIPVENGFLLMAQNATAFPVPQAYTLKAEPNPDCDPTQQMCEMWVPGDYVLKVEICNGECGSSHPHSQVYDRKEANFTITG
ncbi:countin-3-like [Babylonia areolata]|uniref:countin-3-like n=1 Tax=Babylonia areolata TaxID=304850 RepID=UPI003FD45A1D